MLRKRPPLPGWVNEVMKEFTRPPYFLQEALEKQKSTSASPSAAKADADGQSQGKSSVFQAAKSKETEKDKTKPSTAARRNESSAAGRAHSENRRPSVPAERDSDIINTALRPALQDEEIGPSSNWSMVFRKAGVPVQLHKAYGWNVKRASAADGVLRVYTPKNSFALKKTHLTPARVAFLHDAFRFVEEQGFTRFAPLVLSKDGKPYALHKEQVYYATRWQNGQAVNFASAEQVAKVANVLAVFHERSRGFESDSFTPSMEFNLAGMLRRRTEDLRTLLARAQMKRDKDAFDRALASIAVELREQAEESVRLIEDSGCAGFLQSDEDVPGLCHLDVIPGNFIYTPKHDVVAIDFDLCTYAPRALDLSHLLRRSLQKQHWRTKVVYECFVAYHEVRPISGNEYGVIQALMTFPYRAWRVANTRYRTGSAPGQIEEMEECTAEATRRNEFLESFSRQIRRDE